ncbi:MAG TPA: hypothetical protein VF057_00395, partial [Thermoanaerobaculia bacterium]
QAHAMTEAVREQIEEIVWSVFAWDGGTARFTPGRDKHREFVRLDIAIPNAVVEGVRHMPDAKALLARIGTKTTLIARTGVQLDELTLDEDEQHLLESIDGKRALGELVNVPPLAAGVNARLLYAFFVLGLIVVKAPRGLKVKVATPGDKHSL